MPGRPGRAGTIATMPGPGVSHCRPHRRGADNHSPDPHHSGAHNPVPHRSGADNRSGVHCNTGRRLMAGRLMSLPQNPASYHCVH